ncbi:MAG: acyl carrier protein [Lachnospiraceae bacterium]|nr:acyl carrier protein [Lachnospiraceae bacterium]
MFEKMKELIAANLNVETGEITEDTSFGEDLGADSLDLMELVMAFEEEYDVEIPAEDMESLTTVGAVMEYLKGKGVEE